MPADRPHEDLLRKIAQRLRLSAFGMDLDDEVDALGVGLGGSHGLLRPGGKRAARHRFPAIYPFRYVVAEGPSYGLASSERWLF